VNKPAIALTVALLISQNCCQAQTAPAPEDDDPEKPVVAQAVLRPEAQFKPSVFTTMALVETRREPRPWKFVKLMPGREKRWWYRCLNDQGVTITKETYGPIKGVRDERPLKESHPNLWVAGRLGEAAIPWLLGVIAGGVFGKKN